MAEPRQKPQAIRIAEQDIKRAERALAQARKLGSPTQVAEARKTLRESRKALQRMRQAKPGTERREARESFMEDYYNRLGPEVANLVRTDNELRRLFDRAIRRGWDDQTFDSELRKTKWWKDPKKGASWRAAFEMEFNQPPGVWRESLDKAKQSIADLANKTYNMVIPDDVLEQIARRYYYQGWNADERGLRVWLANQFGQTSGATPGGELLDTQRALSEAARAYGLRRDEGWAERTARQVLNPDSNYDEDDAWNELIAEAESLYPVFAGRVSKDRSVRDLAAGYINQLSSLLEISDPNSVDLTDPLLQRAFTNLDEKSQPKLMPLWEFSRAVRKDERWQQTTNALSTYSQIGSNLARMMGFVG